MWKLWWAANFWNLGQWYKVQCKIARLPVCLFEVGLQNHPFKAWYFVKCKCPNSYFVHWTYCVQILSKLCFQSVYFFKDFEIVATITDKKRVNGHTYKVNIQQHFHFKKWIKLARAAHSHKKSKINLKTLVSTVLMHPQGYHGCHKMCQHLLNLN